MGDSIKTIIDSLHRAKALMDCTGTTILLAHIAGTDISEEEVTLLVKKLDSMCADLSVTEKSLRERSIKA